jgi:hypothetical protein
MSKRRLIDLRGFCGLAFWVCLCALSAGCPDRATIWSTESRSPDGAWVAAAHTDQYGGPGTAGMVSTVTLRPQNGPRGEIEVLQVSQDHQPANLRLIWITASHLEITLDQPVNIDFQAITCGGVKITVRNLGAKSAADSSKV